MSAQHSAVQYDIGTEVSVCLHDRNRVVSRQGRMEGHTYTGQVYLRQQLTRISIGCWVRWSQHAELGKSDIPLFLAKHSVNGLYSEVLAAQQNRISQV